MFHVSPFSFVVNETTLTSCKDVHGNEGWVHGLYEILILQLFLFPVHETIKVCICIGIGVSEQSQKKIPFISCCSGNKQFLLKTFFF